MFYDSVQNTNSYSTLSEEELMAMTSYMTCT